MARERLTNKQIDHLLTNKFTTMLTIILNIIVCVCRDNPVPDPGSDNK